MLQETPLAAMHQELGGRMVDFGGWSMPVSYGSQIEEHHCVRKAAGMFDVSHMTIVDITGQQAQAFLRHLLANDVGKLQHIGSALYSAMLNPAGGVIDDLIVYLMPFGYRLVVNCGTREKDLAWINQQAQTYEVEIQERPTLAMIAVQGPTARAKFHSLLAEDERTGIEALKVFSGCFLGGEKSEWFVARTGYTGEEGYELMLPAEQAPGCWQALLDVGLAPCGLGARDTLRLEAGMNLYGHEMNENISPLVANMAWTIPRDSDRTFIGSSALEAERRAGIQEKLVGLVMPSRGVLREGYPVVVPESQRPGVITSGTFSPTLGCSIALARVPVDAGSKAKVVMRGKAVDVDIVKPCFVRHGEPV